MRILDTFKSENKNKVNKLISNLIDRFPEINWQTKTHFSEENNLIKENYISLIVPTSQYEKAIDKYQNLRDKIFIKSSIFDSLISEIINFRDERDWKQYHNPKDLAISLSLEASELLENFQWKSSEEAINENLENIRDELADVVIYALLLSNELDINLEKSIKEKIKKNKIKYPVEKSFGSRKKYTDL